MMGTLQKLPRRDLLAVTASLGGITVLCWIYLFFMARDMSSPEYLTLAALQMKQWNAGYFAMMYFMWAVMMIGMMLPSVAPMILIYAAVARKSEKQGLPVAPTGLFTLGYVLVWILFSLLATTATWGFNQASLLSPMMVANSPFLGASLLIAAGIYQWLPVKESCLQHCRSPFHFISSHWHPGTLGALRMGLSHGIYCLGCCWVLMLLLFVGGVMNLLWIAAITVFVLLEKLLPLGDAGGRWMGVVMIAAGGIVLLIP